MPTLGGVFLSTFMMLIFVAYLNYLVDVYLMYAASAIAANTIIRSALGATAPLFTRQMFTALGVGGGGSLVGGVAAVLAVIPFAFLPLGESIRHRSKFATKSAGMEALDGERENNNNNNNGGEKQDGYESPDADGNDRGRGERDPVSLRKEEGTDGTLDGDDKDITSIV